jgi:GNAT superfamily N-acetyltransferase
MSLLLIRPATIQDITHIVRIRLETLTDEEIAGFTAPEFTITYTSSEELRKVWDKDNRMKDGFEVFIAEKDRTIVGFIVYGLEQDYGCIDNVLVTKQEQGTGIGRALVTHIENLVKSQGYSLMKTDTSENASGVPWKAYGFWRKMGYEDTEERLTIHNYDFKEIPLIKKLE